MIDEKVVARAAELLAAGVSQRKTAKRLAISRERVQAIAAGRRVPRPGRRRSRAGRPRRTGRCSRCGRKLELPCRACAAERARLDEGLPL